MRLHPISIPYRAMEGGSKTAAVIAAFIALIAPFTSITNPLQMMFLAAVPGYVASASWQTIYYTRYRYSLTDDTLAIHSGVLSKRNVKIPVRRIQNVDVRQGALQRLLGVAEVRVETAGDTDDVSLRLLGNERAQELRRRVRELDAGTEDATVFRLKPHELGLLSLFNVDFRLAAAAVSVFTLLPLIGVDTTAVLKGLITLSTPSLIGTAAVGLVLLVWVTGAAKRFAKYSGYTLVISGDSLEYSHGLFRRYEGSIPLQKIQTVTVEETLPKRVLRLASMSAETAGYGPQRADENVVIPLAGRGRVAAVAARLKGYDEARFRHPPVRARRRYAFRYVGATLILTTGLWGAHQFTGFFAESFAWYVPLAYVPIALVAAHLKWRSQGYHLGDSHVVTRSGFWRRRTKVVPYERVQNIIRRRSPFQRRWSLASVTIDTAGSYDDAARALDVNHGTADELLERLNLELQSSLAVRHRKTDITPHRGVDTL